MKDDMFDFDDFDSKLQQEKNEENDNEIYVPKEVQQFKEFWDQLVKDLPEIDEEKFKNEVFSEDFNVVLPDKIVSPESYVKINGIIQNLRNILVNWRNIIDQNYFVRERAVKSMERVLAQFSNGKTEKLREADVELWLIDARRDLARIYSYKIQIDSRIENLDMAAVQIARQMKAIEYGIKTETIDVTNAMDDIDVGIDKDKIAGWLGQ